MEFFATEADRENSQKRVLCLLEALVMCNRLYLRNNPGTPLIYRSGIEYKVPEQFERAELPEVDAVRRYLTKKGAPPDVMVAFGALADQLGAGEHFREIPRIIENGGGDCDNVAAWRCAELRELGIPARPYITWRQRADGGVTYHVIVLWENDGSSEDPSLLLGMGGEERAADRAEEERKLGERMGDFVAGLTRTRTVAGAIRAMSAKPSTTVLGWGGRSLGFRRPASPAYYYGPSYYSPYYDPLDYATLADVDDDWRDEREYKKALLDQVLGVAINSPQNFNQLQYTIPFQTDDSYEDWSPTRPQAFYANPLYPNLPSTPGGGPLFNTRMRDPDDDFDDRFDGAQARRHQRVYKRRRGA